MQVSDFITVERILPEMHAGTKQTALEELARLVTAQGAEVLREEVLRVLKERERLASTGIGEEVAIPHGKLDAMGTLVMGLARCTAGVDFESVDGKPTRLFFVLVAPENSTGIHLKALARISRLCKEPAFRSQLLDAVGSREMLEILCREDARFSQR